MAANSSNRLYRALAIISVLVSIGSFVVAAYSLSFSMGAYNVASNYGPSVEIRGASPLFLTESCEGSFIIASAKGNMTIKRCTMTGSFNVSISIISPHAGTYNVSIGRLLPSQSASSEPWTVEQLLGFIGGRNSTLARPEMWVLLRPFELTQYAGGNTAQNGFEKEITVNVQANVGRSLSYSGIGTVHLGTVLFTLTYHDIPLDRYYQRNFSVEAWIVRFSV